MRETNPCLCIDARGAANHLTHLYDDALAPAGITITQFSQLHTIQSLAEPTLKALAGATRLDRSTLGRNMRVLESLALVTLQPGPDARTRIVKVTRKGRAAFKKAVPLWIGIQEKMQRQLGAEKHALLKELLTDLKSIPDTVRGAA